MGYNGTILLVYILVYN